MTDKDKRQGGRPFKPDGKKPFTGKPAARKGAGKPPQRDKKATPAAAPKAQQGERIAKAMARAGACSRRDAEEWIAAGRVAVNGRVLESPAFNVTSADKITIDGRVLGARDRTRLFLFHKPRGYVTTDRDPEGRATIFDWLSSRHPELPRLMTVGRLDINTEGLLLLTNDGGLARTLELPQTGWLRRYRVRAHGETDQDQLDTLAKGVTVDGVDYAPIEAKLDRAQGANTWITIGLREGKNREVRRVMGSLGLEVNRLIRISFGPFQLGELHEGFVEEVRTRVLRDQLGPALIAQSLAEFDTGEPDEEPQREERARPRREERSERPSRERPAREGSARERPARDDKPPRRAPEKRASTFQRGERPQREERFERDAPPPAQATDRPKPGSRKHVSTLRAERGERLDKERVKIERGATEDRKGRAVVVERVVAARPKPDTETRNGRRFKAEREGDTGDRPLRRKTGDAPRARRTEGGEGERRFEGRAAPRGRPTGDRPQGDRPATGRNPEGRAPRRETGERSFEGRGAPRGRPTGDRPGADRPFGDRPRSSDRPQGDRPGRSDRPQGHPGAPASGRQPGGARRSQDGDRPTSGRTFEGRPPRRDDKPAGEKRFSRDAAPSGERKSFGDRKGPPRENAARRDDRPAGEKRFSRDDGGKPVGKPRAKPAGDRKGPPRSGASSGGPSRSGPPRSGPKGPPKGRPGGDKPRGKR